MLSVTIKRFKELDSTNTYLKTLAAEGAPSFTCVIADRQTKGRGRMGRGFYSPEDSGLYMSILLRPASDLKNTKACDGVLITACTAVAVRTAIQRVLGISTDIKWVNDLYLNGKKTCGILAEGAYNSNINGFEYVVLGIGVNICGSFEGTELEDIATSLCPSLCEDELISTKNRLASEIIEIFKSMYLNHIPNGGKGFFEEYKNALFILGSKVQVLRGDSVRDADVLDLNEDFTLKVRYDDGGEENLNSGEVKLKLR